MIISKTLKGIFVVLVITALFTACGFNIEFSNSKPEPAPLTMDEASSETIEEPPAALSGGISGGLSYPSEFIPPLRVVAFRLVNGQLSGEFSFVQTSQNQTSFQVDGLAPGQYWVVAYTIPEGDGIPQGLAGGYSQGVPCGLSVECTDHSLITVEVLAGQVTGGIDPADWYAPEGAFPEDPNN